MPIKPAFIEQSAIRGQKLQLRVKTDDLGQDNKGGAHVFDAKGHTMDVPLAFARKAGTDDVFTGAVPVKELKAKGFDLKTLQATAFVTTPGAKVWEERNHVVVTPKDDKLLELGAPNMRSMGKSSVTLHSGPLTLDTVRQGGPMTSSHTSSWETAVTGLSFVDTRNFFGGAKTLKVELHPRHTLVEMAPNGPSEIARPNVENLNEMAVVTLTRQADGRYTASAPANKAFFHAFSENGMAADTLTAIKVAVFDPKTGKEDSDYGNRYDVR